MTQCKYRRTEYECVVFTPAITVVERSQRFNYCKLCMSGQIADEISLNTRAIMNMSMDKMEAEADGKRNEWHPR